MVLNISGVHVCGCKHIRGGCLWLLTYQGCMFFVLNILGVHVCGCKRIRGAHLLSLTLSGVHFNGLKHIMGECLWF